MTSNTGCESTARLSILAMTLLTGMAEHAEEAGLDDLEVCFTMARTELALGPWQVPLVAVPTVGRVGFVEGVREVLVLLDDIRMLTEDPAGVVALALARLWVIDGMTWLDRAAAKVAHAYRDRAEERRM